MQPRVFVLQPGNKDFSGASRYGELVHVYDKNESRPSIWDSEYVSEALDRLADAQYHPHVDFVLLAGHMVPTVLFCCALCNAYPAPQALCYDIVSGNYVIRRLGNEPAVSTTLSRDEEPARENGRRAG